MTALADASVADLAVRFPTVHPAAVTVGEIRVFFQDDHKHMALVVEGGLLIATVERDDLSPELSDDVSARTVGTLLERTIPPDASAERTFASMRAAKRRRLAVIDEHGALVGLLCLKTKR